MKSVFGIDMFLHGKVMQPMADVAVLLFGAWWSV